MIRSALFCISALLFVAAGSCNAVQWQTNFEEAKSIAKAQNKPIVLFFTGSDWCVWCKRLESEAFATPEFDQATASKFIFVELDFPQRGAQNQAIGSQNKDLQRRFDVRGFPTIVVLDENGQKIGSTGYRPGGGRAYADHLLKIVEENSAFRAKTSIN